MFNNARIGHFLVHKKLKLELIEHNPGSGCVGLILILPFYLLKKVRLGEVRSGEVSLG
jgi:hypothetical protein